MCRELIDKKSKPPLFPGAGGGGGGGGGVCVCVGGGGGLLHIIPFLSRTSFNMNAMKDQGHASSD